MLKNAVIFAALTAWVGAESLSCPMTTTSTETWTRPSTEAHYTTVYADGYSVQTLTTRATNTNSTVTSTVQDYTQTSVCGPPTTTQAEYTPTVYTGEWSTSLRHSTSCKPYISIVAEWPGTTTFTRTFTTNISKYYAYTSTVPTTERVTSGTSTFTNTVTCATETVPTATAATTVTQALKCAPSNLIGTDGKPGIRERGGANDGIADYRGWYRTMSEGLEDRTGPHKDASACCQACQEDPKCMASIFTGSSATYPKFQPPSCRYWSTEDSDDEGDEDGTCGLAFTVFTGERKIAQGGCGYIAENVFPPQFCAEGQTPRECEESGLGREV
ncbi:hypothetical protein MBLNU230_g8166t1 [Neophaeotheca triangularis]